MRRRASDSGAVAAAAIAELTSSVTFFFTSQFCGLPRGLLSWMRRMDGPHKAVEILSEDAGLEPLCTLGLIEQNTAGIFLPGDCGGNEPSGHAVPGPFSPNVSLTSEPNVTATTLLIKV
ncbi:hypothetical protein KOW79_001103 [Hemibagrus wyckioides]|uniref:Uncharacterized protein n=1 Tax=Hemibagrus wyckioides TaxID=337641 RepID=A0A9D3SVF1_9TELE|nr:hypothetical protein KOW79_001103 [Hemibagrus wyckioides]